MNDKRKRILGSALKLFTEKGIDSTSTASIAKSAKVATGTVFHYFSNKEELVNECYIFVKKQLTKELETVNSKDLRDKGRLYWRTTINWYLNNEEEATFLGIYHHDPKVNGGRSLSIMAEMSGLIVGFFEEGRKKGILKGFSDDYLCLLANESTILAAKYLTENPEVERETFIDAAYELFEKGVIRSG